ncbi:hypothetical protein C4097_06495 [Clostridioides difficile]|nr:hypothetical protein [Clostridioides difficile]
MIKDLFSIVAMKGLEVCQIGKSLFLEMPVDLVYTAKNSMSEMREPTVDLVREVCSKICVGAIEVVENKVINTIDNSIYYISNLFELLERVEKGVATEKEIIILLGIANKLNLKIRDTKDLLSHKNEFLETDKK